MAAAALRPNTPADRAAAVPEALRAHSVPEHPRRPRLRAQQGVSRSASVRADGLHDVAVLVVFVYAGFRSSGRVQCVHFCFAVLAGTRTIAVEIIAVRRRTQGGIACTSDTRFLLRIEQIAPSRIVVKRTFQRTRFAKRDLRFSKVTSG